MKRGRSVNGAEGENDVQPVIVDHAHAKIGGDIAIMPEDFDRVRNRGKPTTHGFRHREMLRRPIGSPHKEGQAENGEPESANRPRNAILLTSRTMHAEK